MAILRRRPVLRAAAIGGGAYSAGRRRRARRRLEELVELQARGDLSDQEFARQRAAVLAEENRDSGDRRWVGHHEGVKPGVDPDRMTRSE
jgi:hypothetical protein